MQQIVRGARLFQPYVQGSVVSCVFCALAERILRQSAHPDVHGPLFTVASLVQPVSQRLRIDEEHTLVLQYAGK